VSDLMRLKITPARRRGIEELLRGPCRESNSSGDVADLLGQPTLFAELS
jgi:hypothetical protein